MKMHFFKNIIIFVFKNKKLFSFCLSNIISCFFVFKSRKLLLRTYALRFCSTVLAVECWLEQWKINLELLWTGPCSSRSAVLDAQLNWRCWKGDLRLHLHIDLSWWMVSWFLFQCLQSYKLLSIRFGFWLCRFFS